MPKSPEEMAQTMVENMPEKTGRSIDEWMQLLAGRKGDKHNETQWNGGLGLSYRITPKWFLRGDGRVFYSDSSGNTDYAYTLTLGFRLKEGEHGP